MQYHIFSSYALSLKDYYCKSHLLIIYISKIQNVFQVSECTYSCECPSVACPGFLLPCSCFRIPSQILRPLAPTPDNLQLPRILLCSVMGPTKPGPPSGPHTGVSSASPCPHSSAQPPWGWPWFPSLGLTPIPPTVPGPSWSSAQPCPQGGVPPLPCSWLRLWDRTWFPSPTGCPEGSPIAPTSDLRKWQPALWLTVSRISTLNYTNKLIYCTSSVEKQKTKRNETKRNEKKRLAEERGENQ